MIKKELMVVQETYTDANGEEKRKWLKVGEIHGSQKGDYMLLYPHINLAALPRKEGDSRLFVSMYDPKPKDGNSHPAAPQAAPQAAPSAALGDDDIPF